MSAIMKSLATALLLGATLAPALRAQSPENPSLSFTINGGLNSGGDLWQVNKQVLRSPRGIQDTATITRRIRPGISAMLGMSYFRSPRLGFNAEIAYYGLGTEQDCRGPAVYQPDTLNGQNIDFNRTVCDGAKGQHISSNVITLQAGAVFRFGNPGHVMPYLRGIVGGGFIGNTFVETASIIQNPSCTTIDNVCEVKIITERNPHTFTYNFAAAFGLALPMGPGYRLDLEGRELFAALPVIDQPALIGVNNQPVSQSRLTLKRSTLFTVGLEVLLERSHPRRY
jgi:hypothetical protein